MQKYNFLTVLFLVSSLFYFTGCKKEQKSSRASIASPVSVTELELKSIQEYYNTSSTALANSELELKSQTEGEYVLQINPRTKKPYKLGDKVKKGEVLVELRNKEQENSIGIESKKLSLEIKEQELVKNKALYKKGGVTMTNVRNAEVAILNARSSYDNALISLKKLKVVAPFNGVIVSLPHYTSNAKVPSGSSIVSIMDYEKMLMEINLPESAINQVKVEQTAYITHYTIKKDTVYGVISELSPAVSAETRTFKGKLLIDNRDLKIRPGMFVKADIVVQHSDSTIVIPKEILLSRRHHKYVYVVEKGVARRRDVKTGLQDEKNIEITEGLKEGDVLVIRGYETLQDKSKVKIQK